MSRISIKPSREEQTCLRKTKMDIKGQIEKADTGGYIVWEKKLIRMFLALVKYVEMKKEQKDHF